MNYRNPYRNEDFNVSIVEWDMKSANISICKEYNLLNASTIEKIAGMHKSGRERAIGLIMQKDRLFAKALEEKFDEVMKIFLEQNNLDIDWDILSIRRDAAFVINKEINYPTIGNYILFRPKGSYSHHLWINPLDIYVGEKIDVKGINDELLPSHEKGILYLIRTLCQCKGTAHAQRDTNEMLADFVLAYKRRELDLDFYREFNATSMFRVNLYGDEVLLGEITEEFLPMVNITYNYEKVILPLIRLVR